MWGGGQAIEGDVVANLQAADAPTVAASIHAAMQGQLQSDALKGALISAASRTDLPTRLRQHALEVLGARFKLKGAEYDQLLQMRGTLASSS
jgi:hypothetical protein